MRNLIASMNTLALFTLTLSGCGGGGGGGNNPTPDPIGSCDVNFTAGVSTNGTAYFELSRRDLYVIDSDCLYGEDEIHVAESVMDVVADEMQAARENFDSTIDFTIGDCEYEINGHFEFKTQQATILSETPLSPEDSVCGWDLFMASEVFDQMFILRIQDAVLRGDAAFADGDVGRILFDFSTDDIAVVD